MWLYNIGVEVISNTFFSKLSYMFKRVFIRIGDKFFFYFFIALILAFILTFVYYKYINRLLKKQERNILNLLKAVIRPIAPLFRRKKKGKELTEHEIFTRRQLRKMEQRKKMLDMFGSKRVKKEAPASKELKKERPAENVEEEGYVMWPPKSKKEEEEEKVFDKLSKIK